MRAAVERYFGADPGEPVDPAAGRPVAAAHLGGEHRETVSRPCAPATGLRRRSGRRPSATRASMPSTSRARSWPAARAAGWTAGWCATSGSPRTSRCSRSASSAARRSAPAGRRSGRRSTSSRVEAAFHEELAAGHGARQRRRTRPRQGPRRGGRARRLPARRGAGRPAVDVRDAVRRSRADQPDADAVPVGERRGRSETVAAAVFRPENRLVLTYLPEAGPATSDSHGDGRMSRSPRSGGTRPVGPSDPSRTAAPVRVPGRRDRTASPTA